MSYRATIFFTLAPLLLVSATLAHGSEDPELRQCQHQCRAQTTADQKQVRECIQRCEDYDRRKHGGHGGANTEEEEDLNERSPIERLRDCNRRCEQHPQGERREGCQRLCQQEYERERQPYEERTGHRSRQGSSGYQKCRRDCQQGPRREKESCEERCDRTYHHRRGGENRPEEEEEMSEGEARRGWSYSSNPYVFEERHFLTGMRSEFGRLRILQKFTDRSELLRGIENFRVGIFETQPQTFVVPNHWDADFLIFVANGN